MRLLRALRWLVVAAVAVAIPLLVGPRTAWPYLWIRDQGAVELQGSQGRLTFTDAAGHTVVATTDGSGNQILTAPPGTYTVGVNPAEPLTSNCFLTPRQPFVTIERGVDVVEFAPVSCSGMPGS